MIKAIKVSLNDKTVEYGILTEIKKENEIIAWKFIPHNYAIVYQQTKDKKLIKKIPIPTYKTLKINNMI